MTPLFPSLGLGLGLRSEHYDHYLAGKPAQIDWVEAITENYLAWEEGTYLRSLGFLEKVRREMPVVLHGVSLSLGSTDPLNESYLRRLHDLVQRVEPAWVSDHLCWTGVHGHNAHDLLPLPYTEEAVAHVAGRIMRVQDLLGRRILIENVSSYVEFTFSRMTEWEFITEVVKRSDCGLLLDVNNVFVSSFNHEFDPMEYLKGIPLERVGQIHLAGHRDGGNHRVDTHDEPVCPEVWALYRWVLHELGMVSTLLEWDDNYPEWEVLLAELGKAREIAQHERNSAARASRKISPFPAVARWRRPERNVVRAEHQANSDPRAT